MHSNFSVIIVTKNRSTRLYKCVESLFKQPFSVEDEILIINNGASLISPSEFDRKAKIKNVHIKIFSSRGTISHCRNIGLSKAKNDWCIFIDDDCLATNNWLQEIRTGISGSASAAVFIGSAASMQQNNIFSLATRFHYDYWVKENIVFNKIMNLILLDTKNCVINKQFITNHTIFFDESLKIGEDSDFGLQIQQNGGGGVYLHNALVLHADPVTLGEYITKQSAYTFSAMTLLKKWTNLYPNKTHEVPILRATVLYVLNIPFFLLRVPVFLLLMATHAANKLVFFLFHHNILIQQLQTVQAISIARYFKSSSEGSV